MFRFRAFPNLLDDFLVSYRFAEILSQRWRCSGVFSQSQFLFPSIAMTGMPILNCSVSKNHSNIWFGDASEFQLDIDGRNFAFQTSLRSQNSELMSKMDGHWRIDEEFVFPFKSEEAKFEESMFAYIPAMPDRMLKETIEAWMLSNEQRMLKIFAPYWSFTTIKQHVAMLRKKHKSKKRIQLFCPSESISLEKLKQEILKCSAVIDFRTFPGVSYSTTIAQSAGIPTIGTENTFPKPDISTISKRNFVQSDGGIFHGKNVSEFSLDDLVISLNQLKNFSKTEQKDEQKNIISMFSEIAKGR